MPLRPGAGGDALGLAGGIASSSVHGWLWGALALAGTFAGLKARGLFGLVNPKPTDSVC